MPITTLQEIAQEAAEHGAGAMIREGRLLIAVPNAAARIALQEGSWVAHLGLSYLPVITQDQARELAGWLLWLTDFTGRATRRLNGEVL